MHCWASDAAAQWLVLGSSTGQCVLFDLRYQLRLGSWSCGARSRIHCMVPYRAPPVGGSGLPAPQCVLLGSGAGLLTGWELGHAPRCSLVLLARSLYIYESIIGVCSMNMEGDALAA